MEHNPTPWAIDGEVSESWFIHDANYETVLQTFNKFEQDFPNKEANAQFIVTACNFHDKLKEMLAQSDEILAGAEDIAHGELSKIITLHRVEIQNLLKQLK